MNMQIDIPALESLQRQLSEVSDKLDRIEARLSPAKELWTTADMAKFHGVQPSTVRKWVSEGKLECVRHGKKMMFEPQSRRDAKSSDRDWETEGFS